MWDEADVAREHIFQWDREDEWKVHCFLTPIYASWTISVAVHGQSAAPCDREGSMQVCTIIYRARRAFACLLDKKMFATNIQCVHVSTRNKVYVVDGVHKRNEGERPLR
jgi:hypothetical protein